LTPDRRVQVDSARSVPVTSSANLSQRGKQRPRRAWIFVAAAGFPIWLGIAWALDANGHRQEPTDSYDAIVVAGCRVLPEGRPSLSLIRRATKAVELWRRGVAPVIAFTGGVGDWPPAEAVAAAEVARSLGVPDSALLLESRSKSTIENARFLREQSNYARIIVVTDTYHVRRCEWFFRKYFMTVDGYGVVSPLSYRARGALREALAYAYYIVLGPWKLPDGHVP
jgi:uncharacterized SAM-binding protein YcdF (DUF218 family)